MSKRLKLNQSRNYIDLTESSEGINSDEEELCCPKCGLHIGYVPIGDDEDWNEEEEKAEKQLNFDWQKSLALSNPRQMDLD